MTYQALRSTLVLLLAAVVLVSCTSQAPQPRPAETGQPSKGMCQIGSEPSKTAMNHLIKREGVSARVYTGANGKPTAGVGHVLSPDELKRYPLGAKVPERVRANWIRADSATAWRVAASQAREIGEPCLTETLFAVVYQLGPYWHTIHKKTWQHLVANDWVKAAAEAEDSLWHAQTKLRVQDFQAGLRNL